MAITGIGSQQIREMFLDKVLTDKQTFVFFFHPPPPSWAKKNGGGATITAPPPLLSELFPDTCYKRAGPPALKYSLINAIDTGRM